MSRAALTIALATFLGAPVVWADEPTPADSPAPATAEPKVEATPANNAVKDDSPGEIVLDNAAVNRVFINEPLVPVVIPPKPHRFGFYFGVRAMNVKNPGYDPFSDSDAFVQNAIGFSFSPWRTRPWSLHFLAEWNLGASTSNARGAPTDLLVNRLALGVEGRWSPGSRLYLFAKIVPAAAHFGGTIDDYDLGVKLESSSWAFLLDTSAGAAVRLGTAGQEPKRTASFWLMMDWGYTFAGQATMSFRPADIDDETRTFGAVNLPNLRLGGFVTRTSFAVTF